MAPAGGAGRIAPDDLTHPAVLALIARHLANSQAHSPPESIHALDLDGLRGPDVAAFVLWRQDTPLAIGALKRLSRRDGEIKSMHVAEAARRQRLGARMLAHIEAQARAQGMTRLWLETGSMAAYGPAQALYLRAGYLPCAPFGRYRADANSAFFTRRLDGRADPD
jgi:putative acetyltransferase